MAIISKADASISDGSEYSATDAKDAKILPSTEYDTPAWAAPPTYEDAQTESPQWAASRWSAGLPPATNHYYIKKVHGGFFGTYNINTRLAVPAPFLEDDSEGRENHLHLETSNGAINAKLALTSGSFEPAKIALLTKNGTVSCRVLSRVAEQPVKITMKTYNGAITVGLPRTFHGPLTHITRCGVIKFSPDLQAQITLAGGDRSFVGDWNNATDFDKSPTIWPGDEVLAETRIGAIKFSYVDELEREEQNGIFSGFKSFFGW